MHMADAHTAVPLPHFHGKAFAFSRHVLDAREKEIEELKKAVVGLQQPHCTCSSSSQQLLIQGGHTTVASSTESHTFDLIRFHRFVLSKIPRFNQEQGVVWRRDVVQVKYFTRKPSN